MIGQELIQDEHDLELLLVSAKYHDVGRETDAHELHAEPSAKIAAERLKDKYSPEDIAVICTIIEFHEAPENLPNIEDIFIGMARKNGVSDDQIPRVRHLANILKDADALDRTRFINRARLNPEYLHFDVSKRLIKFASSLQETYAIQDLKEFQCDDEIGILLRSYTPQEVLRTIRHSTRGYLRIEDVQSFIRSWANSSTQKESDLQDMLGEANGVREESVDYGNRKG